MPKKELVVLLKTEDREPHDPSMPDLTKESIEERFDELARQAGEPLESTEEGAAESIKEDMRRMTEDIKKKDLAADELRTSSNKNIGSKVEEVIRRLVNC